ncbi:MAG: LPS export ABC transporter permease LptF [Pseudomonadota bacterium]
MRIARYLAGDVLAHTSAVSLVLLAIIITGRFVKYLAQAATGELAADVLLPIMFYRLPYFLELLLPLSLFIGILMSYGRFYVESEMTVLSACGTGPARLALYTAVPALLITLVVAALTLYLTPLGSERSEQLLRDPGAMRGLQMTSEGRFQAWNDNSVVSYARRIDRKSGEFERVFFFETSPVDSDTRIESITVAELGRVVRNDEYGARYVELNNGVRYTGTPGQADFELIRFETFAQRLPPIAPIVRKNAVDGRPTRFLLSSDLPEDRAALHWRASMIVMVPIIALIAMTFSKTNHRRGRYLQLVPALLAHLTYLLLLASARTRVGEGEAGPEQIWLIHLVFLLLALGLLGAPALRQLLQR